MLKRYLLPVVAMLAVAFAVMELSNASTDIEPVRPPVEPSRSPFHKQLAGAGIIEPETENITIGVHLPGVVTRQFVQVGDSVQPGEPLFQMDDRRFQAERQARKADLANAQAMLTRLERMPRSEEVPPAEASVSEAKAMLEDARQQFERYKKLSNTNSVSNDELIRSQMAVEVANARLRKAETQLNLLLAGAWEEDIEVARAAVSQAEAKLNEVETEIDRLIVRAPTFPLACEKNTGEGECTIRSSYLVLQVNVRPGEFVGTLQGQSTIILGRTGKLHVRVDIDENDIPRFQKNLPGLAIPRGDAANKYQLKFVRVEPYVIPKRSLTGANTERVDTRVLQVIYAIEGEAESLYVGQQVDVFLDGDVDNTDGNGE